MGDEGVGAALGVDGVDVVVHAHLQLSPADRARLDFLVMGGALALDYTGARRPCVEDNFGHDPEAARRRFASDARIALVPADSYGPTGCEVASY